MDALLNIAAKILSNKWFWIGLIILIAIILIHKNWEVLKIKLFGKKAPSYATDTEGNVLQVTQLDQRRLNQMVTDLHTAITRFGGMDASDFEQVLALTDQELEYVGKTYKGVYQTSLFQDINDEWLPLISDDEKLQARLSMLGLGT